MLHFLAGWRFYAFAAAVVALARFRQYQPQLPPAGDRLVGNKFRNGGKMTVVLATAHEIPIMSNFLALITGYLKVDRRPAAARVACCRQFTNPTSRCAREALCESCAELRLSPITAAGQNSIMPCHPIIGIDGRRLVVTLPERQRWYSTVSDKRASQLDIAANVRARYRLRGLSYLYRWVRRDGITK